MSDTAASRIEWLQAPEARPRISHVVFDFDGTLSWLRHGWPAIMRDLSLEHVPRQARETAESLDRLLDREILSLNGQPTIFQMRRCCQMIGQRGGAPPDPESLRIEYQRRLDAAIDQRTQQIRNGQAFTDDFLLFGARPLLKHLRESGFTLAILSSTVVERVCEEARLLDIDAFFGRHIYGGVGDPLLFSKRSVFERLLREEGVEGTALVSFGDGPVEIADTRSLGGIAVGVCSDEHVNGSGVCHPIKRQQLTEAGAHCLVPDFRDGAGLIDQLLGKG
jgi:phosphoglycolate phosphatase-like HAD superfamily hydrolase